MSMYGLWICLIAILVINIDLIIGGFQIKEGIKWENSQTQISLPDILVINIDLIIGGFQIKEGITWGKFPNCKLTCRYIGVNISIMDIPYW